MTLQEKIENTFFECLAKNWTIMGVPQRAVNSVYFHVEDMPRWTFMLQVFTNENEKVLHLKNEPFFCLKAIYCDYEEHSCLYRTLSKEQFVGKTNGEVRLLFMEVIDMIIGFVRYHPIKAWGAWRGLLKRNVLIDYIREEVLNTSGGYVATIPLQIRAHKMSNILKQDPRVSDVKTHIFINKFLDTTYCLCTVLRIKGSNFNRSNIPTKFLNYPNFYFSIWDEPLNY